MRKFLIFIISLFALSSGMVMAQQVNRDMVILEISTGTWCYYCTGAAMGANDLIENEKNVAIIEYHKNDDFNNSFGTSRIGFYGMVATPMATFDGLTVVDGADHSTSSYPAYLEKYNEKIAIPSSFTIDIEGANSGFSEFSINVKVTKVADASSTGLVLHFALTESEIIKPWQGLNKLDFVERAMYPDQYGTALDFSSDTVNDININFTINPSWENKNCEVVVFIQDPSTKEIFQGAKRKLYDFESSNSNDVAILAAYCPSAVCENTLTPIINIANYGSVNLTTFDFVYSINNGEEHKFNWTGNLSPMSNKIVELPSFNFEISGNSIFNVFTNKPNGQEDGFHQNDTIKYYFNIAKEVNNTVALALKLDDSPKNISWEIIKNMSGEVLYSGNNYTTPNRLVYKTFDLQDGCYSFKIYDQEGNGLLGSGMWNLIYNNSTIIAHGNNFGLQQEVQFSVTSTNVDDYNKLTDFKIYPNPVNNMAYMSFNLNCKKNVSINIYNSLGKIVYNMSNKILKNGANTIEINTSQFTDGIYYVNINNNGKNYQHKIAVIK